LYPDLASKAAELGHSLIQNHPFVDGNKRVGHAAMEVFLLLNGHEIDASVDEQETIIIDGKRESFKDRAERVVACTYSVEPF
jgi:death-on-curing protein